MKTERGRIHRIGAQGPRLAISLCAALTVATGGLVRGEEPRPKQVTYMADIAPILRERCVQCHQPETVAPMALRTYEEARPWANSIRKETANRRMPPFHAEGPIGRYADDPRLTEDQIALIKRWVDGGAARGEGEEPFVATTAVQGWRLGVPDLVIHAEPHPIDVRATDDLTLIGFDYVFEADTWIRGIEIASTAPKSMHHATLFLTDPKRKAQKEDEENPFASLGDRLETWLPGYSPTLAPGGEAILIPRGQSLVIFAHYAPVEGDREDRISLGIHLANGAIYGRRQFLQVIATEIRIEPGQSDYELRESRRIERDSLIQSFHTHMHYRGKSFEVRLHRPGDAQETVFEIPRYDFNWQREYRLAEPLRVEAGAVVEFIGRWDNSAENPQNPDPSQLILGGLKTREEMWTASIRYDIEAKTGPKFWVRDGRVVEGPRRPDSGF